MSIKISSNSKKNYLLGSTKEFRPQRNFYKIKRTVFFVLLSIVLCNLSCKRQGPKSGIQIINNGENIALYYNGDLKLTRSSVVVKFPDSTIIPYRLAIIDNTIKADLGEYGIYQESFSVLNQNSIKGKIELIVKTDKPFIIECPFEFSKPDTSPYFMIPSFLYGTNNIYSSTGNQPKLNYQEKNKNPGSSVIYTRSDRSSHPGVFMISEKSVTLVGIHEKLESNCLNNNSVWESDHLYTGLFINTSESKKDLIGYTLGYEHYPFRYNGKTSNPAVPGQDKFRFGWIENCAKQILTANTFYYIGQAKDKTEYGEALKQYYYDLHELPAKRDTRDSAIKKLINAQINDSWNKKHKYFKVIAKPHAEGDVGWTGGMVDAYPLLLAGIKTKNEQAKNVAITYIENLVTNGFNSKANLLFEANSNGRWMVAGWWKGHIYKDFGMESAEDFNYHSAYINGQASYYLLKSYELTGGIHDQWFDIAKKTIETAMNGQNDKGCYPSFFSSEDGSPVDYSWFHSCWFVPGAAMLYQITGETKYLESARRAILYYNKFHKRGEVYGTPMDTHKAVDQEGNIAFVAGCTELHKATNDSVYYSLARDGLNWEFSWKFAYNSAHSNDPLKSLNWSTSGGSVTSTHNVHIHHMSNLMAEDIYYWYRQFDDPYIGNRLKDMSIWGLGSFNTVEGEFGFGKVGWATEQFFHTDAVQDNNLPWDGGVWNDYLSWSAASVLFNCAADIPDSFFEK